MTQIGEDSHGSHRRKSILHLSKRRNNRESGFPKVPESACGLMSAIRPPLRISTAYRRLNRTTPNSARPTSDLETCINELNCSTIPLKTLRSRRQLHDAIRPKQAFAVPQLITSSSCYVVKRRFCIPPISDHDGVRHGRLYA
jgi:hypothetical protein